MAGAKWCAGSSVNPALKPVGILALSFVGGYAASEVLHPFRKVVKLNAFALLLHAYC
jgi:hypothetical protein